MNFSKTPNNLLLVTLALSLAACAQNGQAPGTPTTLSGLEVAAPARDELIFSTLEGIQSSEQTLTLANVGDKPLELTRLELGGTSASSFSLEHDLTLPAVIEPGGSLSAEVAFDPESVGRHQATLSVESNDPDDSTLEVGLYGLAAAGEQGENEPALQDIVNTLGYPVDVGGSALELGSSESAIGSESLIPLFKKAGSGPVTLSLVGRYGPDETMPFGYFTLKGSAPNRTEVARVSAEESQKLLPSLESGSDTFDPGSTTFGIYAQAGGNYQYSLDTLNTSTIKHAVRVYPLLDRQGNSVPNSYLLGVEEAQNADYQDAVFVLSNVVPADASEDPGESGWEPLFNGQDLSGWYTYLPGLGKNNDPEGVFKVENGMLHILGVPNTGHRDFGYLMTEQSFENYQLRFEYKWGTARFAPRATSKRDSGVVYHVSGGDKIWPRGVEYQIQEGDTGDFWMIGGTTLATTVLTPQSSQPQYMQNGHPYSSRPGSFVRIVKNGTYDSAQEWNTAEITVQGNTATHAINGVVNNRAYSLYSPDGSPLTSGRILFQAEGAEIFYRNIEIRKLAD